MKRNVPGTIFQDSVSPAVSNILGFIFMSQAIRVFYVNVRVEFLRLKRKLHEINGYINHAIGPTSCVHYVSTKQYYKGFTLL